MVRTSRGGLGLLNRRERRRCLVCGDARIRYVRAGGSTGSLYPDVLVAHNVELARPRAEPGSSPAPSL